MPYFNSEDSKLMTALKLFSLALIGTVILTAIVVAAHQAGLYNQRMQFQAEHQPPQHIRSIDLPGGPKVRVHRQMVDGVTYLLWTTPDGELVVIREH
jgi:hypothetical protein